MLRITTDNDKLYLIKKGTGELNPPVKNMKVLNLKNKIELTIELTTEELFLMTQSLEYIEKNNIKYMDNGIPSLTQEELEKIQNIRFILQHSDQ